MSLFAIAWKSIRQRGLASALTALSVALGVMLMVVVLVISGAVDSAFNQRSIAYDLIVGPKGSGLQLVLSAVFRVQPAIENLPYMYYQQLKEDPRVESAVPMAFGDVTEEGSFPLVGTTTEYFENDYTPGEKFQIRGKRINGHFDAIIGSEVARRNSWDIGSQFKIRHGGADGTHVHNEMFTVVAVTRQTGTPNDRTVFVNIEGFYAIAGHETPLNEVEDRLKEFYASDPERLKVALAQIAEAKALEKADSATGHDGHHHHATPDAAKEVTAILIRTRPDLPFAAIKLSSELKEGYQAMAVNPMVPIRQLMNDVLGNVKRGLVVLTGMIILVSGVSIFVSIYNSMSDRRREIGIMRALGARRGSVFGIVLTESIVLCVGGGLLGWLVGHGMSVLAAPYVTSQTGLLLDPWAVDWMEFALFGIDCSIPRELVLFPVLLALATLVGFLPAMTAYRTDVADALSG
ncbi:MAG: FtsX-like permease family protein [Planctomycetaceae bacterium]|jgi:putative ABC transport system permease protein